MILDNGEILISIDGSVLELQGSASLGYCQIFEDCRTHLPTIELQLIDSIQKPELPAVADGSVIQVTLRDSYGNEVVSEFRVTSFFLDYRDDVTNLVTMNGVLSAPDFFYKSAFDYVQGPASQVAEKIANDNSLATSDPFGSTIDTTSDSMTWIRHGITSAEWLHHVTRHAYKDDTSYFASCVTKQHELRMVNIAERQQQDPRWTFQQQEQGVTLTNSIGFHRYDLTIASGFLNKWRGYGQYSLELDVLTGEYRQPQADKMVKSKTNSQINESLLAPTTVVSAPLNCGNTHENYAKAYLQNTRLLSTHSTIVSVLSANPSIAPRLLDSVLFEFTAEQDVATTRKMTGQYILASISTLVTNNQLSCRYYGTTDGFDTEIRTNTATV